MQHFLISIYSFLSITIIIMSKAVMRILAKSEPNWASQPAQFYYWRLGCLQHKFHLWINVIFR